MKVQIKEFKNEYRETNIEKQSEISKQYFKDNKERLTEKKYM